MESYTHHQIFPVVTRKEEVKKRTVESEERKLIKKWKKEERAIEGSAVIVEEQTAGRP